MPWSRTSEGSLAIYGDEGEWIATCSNSIVAGEIVEAHNANVILAGIFNASGSKQWLDKTPKQIEEEVSQQMNQSRKFSKDVDAMIDIADKHLAMAKDGLIFVGQTGEVVPARPLEGWTTQL